MGQLQGNDKNVVHEVKDFLAVQAEKVRSAGVPGIMLDPGYGFGKTLEHNLTLVKNLDVLAQTGYPVLLGASRKSTIHKMANVPDAKERDPGSIALHLCAASKGAAMIRVHNVAAHIQALKVWEALHA